MLTVGFFFVILHTKRTLVDGGQSVGVKWEPAKMAWSLHSGHLVQYGWSLSQVLGHHSARQNVSGGMRSM